MDKTLRKEKYASLERELGDRKRTVPYHALKNSILEAVLTGHNTVATEEQYLTVVKALGLSKNAETDLKELYSAAILPLIQRLRATSSVCIDFGAVMHLEFTEEDTKNTKARLAPPIIRDVSCIQSENITNIKALMIYPILIGELNEWRSVDSEFVDKIINGIKANEPEQTLRTLIEQLDIPVTQNQLKRN